MYFHPVIDKNGRERAPTLAEAMKQLDARSKAKALAQQQAADREAARKAAEPKRPVNPAAIILDKMERLPPRVRSELERQAERRGREIAAIDAEQARKAAIEADPAVAIMRENVGFVKAAARGDFVEEMNELVALAEIGDSVPTYWAKVRELEQKIWQRDDEAAQAALVARGQASEQFNQQAARAVESQKRLAAANAQVGQQAAE